MKHIEINVWKSCNNKCRFCMSSMVWIDEKSLNNYDLLIKEIKKYSSMWYKSIWFLWWDISIHPKIYEIISYAKINWFLSINVITNSMVFSDYKKAEKLIISWVTRVNISVHSHNVEIEDYITQVNWWLIKKLQAIDNFQKLYNNWLLYNQLSINIVLNWLNYRDILKTCIYFNKIKNIKDIRINFLWNRFFFSSDDKNKLELSYTDFLPYLKILILYSLKSDLRLTFDAIPPCIFSKLWFNNNDFIIERFLGDTKDHIEEVSNVNKNQQFNWKDQKKDELKTKFDNCNKCLYFEQCQWVWIEYVDSFWCSEFIAINKK